MTQSILDGRKILAIDDEPDVLAVLEGGDHVQVPERQVREGHNVRGREETPRIAELRYRCPGHYGRPRFDLLEIAVKRNLKVAMLTAHALTPEALKRSYDMRARAYLPKNKLGEVVPFLEDVLKYDYQSGLEAPI